MCVFLFSVINAVKKEEENGYLWVGLDRNKRTIVEQNLCKGTLKSKTINVLYWTFISIFHG